MIIIFFGPPGAGKGTQATLISEKLDIPHISTGDILRKSFLETNQISKQLKQTMDSGNLVSDDSLNQIIEDRLSSDDCKKGFILDGYPRTIIQKNFLNQYLEDHNLFISKIFDLDLDSTDILERIKSRSGIENREDDKEKIIKVRIERYLKETKPISSYYSVNFPNDYHVINSNQEIQNITKNILEILKKWRFLVLNWCFLPWLIC